MVAACVWLCVAGCFLASAQVVGVVDFRVTNTWEGAFADVAVDAQGRIFLLDAKGKTVTVRSPDLGLTLATYDVAAAGTGRVVAFTVDPQGNLWVADEGGNLVVLDAVGRPQRSLRLPSRGVLSLAKPTALLWRDDLLWVVCRSCGTLAALAEDGTVQVLHQGRQPQGTVFLQPLDLGIDVAGYLYLADGAGGGLCQLDPWGQLRYRWRAAQGEVFRQPLCVSGDAWGLVFVADAAGRCVVLADTVVVGTFGAPGPAPGQLGRPVAMAVTPRGELVLVETTPERVQLLDPVGLQAVRQALRTEDPFLMVRTRPSGFWPCEAGQVACTEHLVAVAMGPEVRVGSWYEPPESWRAVSALTGSLNVVRDMAFGPRGDLLVVDGLGHVLHVSPDLSAVDTLGCPTCTWKAPQRVAHVSGEPVVYDAGTRALFLPARGVRVDLPATSRDPVAGFTTAPGGVGVVLRSGHVVTVDSTGNLRAGPRLAASAIVAAVPWHEGTMVALEGGGIVGCGPSGEVLVVCGLAAGADPSLVVGRDLAVADTLLVVLTGDGLDGFTVDHPSWGGIQGNLEGPPGSPFALRLISAVRTDEWVRPLTPGAFRAVNVPPGEYSWEVRGKGWRTLRGTSPVFVSPRKSIRLGTLVAQPAGWAAGHATPAVEGVELEATREGSVEGVATTDSTGAFLFTDLLPGHYVLRLRSTGVRMVPSEMPFTVVQAETTRLETVSLVVLGSCRGYVKPWTADQEVWAVREGALVEVVRPEALHEPEGGGVPLGRFEFRHLDPGPYTIVVRTRGFYPDTSLSPVVITEGQASRCGTAVLVPSPPEEASGEALRLLDRAFEDYTKARFSSAQEVAERLLATHALPSTALERAAMLAAWCAVARGRTQVAEGHARWALFVNPYMTCGPEVSPAVCAVVDSVRITLFGPSGPPPSLLR